MPGKLSLAALVLLNLLPVYGVLAWGWQSFDLIFLYWLENVLIGLVTALRMLVRPYPGPAAFLGALFFTLFFTVHYGGFCFGHGMFLLGVFGDEQRFIGDAQLPAVAAMMVLERQLLLPLIALAALALLDWLHDDRENGFAHASVQDLMARPYRRIVVLHVTIIVGAFVLSATGEPLAGLLLLVAVKTFSDIRHWRRDEQRDRRRRPADGPALSEAEYAELAARYPEPKVTVNGRDRHFASFAALKGSPEFRRTLAMMRMLGQGQRIRTLEAYLDRRIAEERADNVPAP